MFTGRILQLFHRYLARISRDFTRSFRLFGVMFPTAEDVRTIFPESIRNEGKSEHLTVPDLKPGQTLFLLQGVESPGHLTGWLKGLRYSFPAPFEACFQASEQRKLFTVAGCLLIKDAKLGSFLIGPEYRSPHRVLSAFRKATARAIPSFLGVSSWKSRTFGDFGLLILPKLGRMAGQPKTALFTDHLSLPFVRQYLEILEIPPAPAELPEKALTPITEFAQLVIGPGVAEGFLPARSDIEALRKRILPRLKPPRSREIYLCRAGRRKISNEAACLPLLRQLGFEIVPDEHTDVLAQAALFHDASIIVAPHGAVLANLMYCKPGTVVIELLPGSYVAICYRALAASMDLPYHAIICTELGSFQPSHYGKDFTVDPEALRAAIKNILDRHQTDKGGAATPA